MDAGNIVEITQAEDFDNPILEMLDAAKEQLIHLAKIVTDKTKKAVLIAMLSFTMSPVQAELIQIDSMADCTEIVVASPADKYYNKLNDISLLEDDWDGEGAKVVNGQAIENVRRLVCLLPDNVLLANIKLFPSELGAVSLKLSTEKGTIRSEIGDSIFSYYVKRQGIKDTEHHSFEEWTEPNIAMFMTSLLNLV